MVKVIRRIKFHWLLFKVDWSKFKTLWSVTPPDCRHWIILEFLFDSDALNSRFHKEILFQNLMKKHWRSNGKRF